MKIKRCYTDLIIVDSLTMYRCFSLTDKMIGIVDSTLKLLIPNDTNTQVPSDHKPAHSFDKSHSAALMRVNHCGEVCAQALYYGQSLFANGHTYEHLMQAAKEEYDHLTWCRIRLKELNNRPSYLNPLWHISSIGIGAFASFFGDKYSLGFIAETETQVAKHLDNHLEIISKEDKRSRDILQQMKDDELKHKQDALDLGGKELPSVVKKLMYFSSKFMTISTRYL